MSINNNLKKVKPASCKICGTALNISIYKSASEAICNNCRNTKRLESKKLQEGVTCIRCGKTFYDDFRKYPSKLPPKFCSRSCSNSYAATSSKCSTKTVKCIVCGKLITVNSHGRNSVTCSDCLKDAANTSRATRYQFLENTDIGMFERSQMFKQKSKNLEKLGFDFEKPLKDEFFKLKNLLENLYLREELSTLVIKDMYEIPSTVTVPNLLRILNIPIRSFKEASKVGIKQGRIVPLANLSSIRSVYKHGYYIDFLGREHYLRSSLEFDLAKKLDELKLEYITEKEITYFDTVAGDNRKGYPDFFLPEQNTFIETKSSWFYDERNLTDRASSILKEGQKFLVLTYNVANQKKSLSKIDNFGDVESSFIKSIL